MSVFQMIYVSKCSDDFDFNTLPSILEKSRRDNEKKDVSGLLIFHEGSFIQVLEGPKEAVEEIYQKIEKDDRHKNIKLLSQKMLDEKEFESWSMGFLKPELSKTHPDFVDLASELTAMLTEGATSAKALDRFRDGAWKKLVESG